MRKLQEKIKNKLGEKKTAKLKKSLHIARIVKNIVCWTLIAILTIAVILFMVTKITGGSPSLFGYSLHRIVTGSMSPELEIGDVIFSREIKDVSDVQVGDIVTFQGDNSYDYKLVTHRVLVAPYDDGRGNTIVITKGDANENDDGEINFSTVQSKFLAKVDYLKMLYNFFFSTWGFLIFIFLLLLIFFDEIVNIIKLTVGAAKEEETESFQEIVERVKREQLEEARKKREAERAEIEKQKELPDPDQSKSDESESDDVEEIDTSLSDIPQFEEESENAEAEEQESEEADKQLEESDTDKQQPIEEEADDQKSEDTEVEQASKQDDADAIDLSLFEETQPEENETGEEQPVEKTQKDESSKDDEQHQKSQSEKRDTKTEKPKSNNQHKSGNNQKRNSSKNKSKKNSKKRKKR